MEIQLPGYRMHCHLAGDPAGEPLLWLHGWSGTGGDWKYFFGEAPSGFQIIGPDLRGHGASSGFEGRHSFREFARDVFALLDHLGVSRVKALGLSGGGITLMHMATRQPQRIEAMISVSAPPYFVPQARARQRQFSLAALGQGEADALRERCPGGAPQMNWIVEQAHLMAETYDDVNFTPPLLGTIQARTLIVSGDSDPLCPINLAVEVFQAIPRASLWVVPNAGHGPIFGPHAPRFAETALHFLRGDWPGK